MLGGIRRLALRTRRRVLRIALLIFLSISLFVLVIALRILVGVG
jgi:hypothetical protein